MNQFLPGHLLTPPPDAPPGLALRVAVEDDLRPLHTTCYADKSLLQFRSHFAQMLEWQENGRCCWLIVEDESGQIIGSGQLVLYPHGNELANLVVIPARQNEGIGTALIGVLTAVAHHLGLDSLEIGVDVSNGRALRLYQRLGFTVDRRLNLPNQEPALILYKAL